MKNKSHIGIYAVLFTVFVILLVWYLLFGKGILNTNISTQLISETKEVKAEKLTYDISGIDEAYEAILSKSTKNFIGSYPIDEEFLGWFVSYYGTDALESIASYATLDDPSIWSEVTGCSIHVLWYYYLTEYKGQEISDTYVATTESSYQTVLRFTGDYSLAEGVGTTTFFHSQGDDITKCFSDDLLSMMQSADILTINNEFVYSDRGEALAGKTYVFRSSPSYVSNLEIIGADVVGLANNHVYDYGEVGLLDTLDTIQEAGFPTIGAGRDLDEASAPVYYIAGGKKIAFVAATQIERSTNYTKEATEDSAGVLKTLNATKYVEVIKEAKENADYVICYVHWGTEGDADYGNDQYNLAVQFVEAGADAIIGSHTHCLQGVDLIDDVPVFYSLGNFYFSQEPEMPEDYDTAMAELVITSDGSLQARLVPCHFSSGVLDLMTDEDEIEDLYQYLEEYSGNATLDDQGYIVSN